jgi:arsenate reductase
MKKRVLFLCTGNSCRSHMAEGLTNYYLGDTWEAVSAGTEPSGYVHPLAIAALAERGIDISDHTSKTADQFGTTPLDLVITVCDDAAENCPLWLGQGNVVHISFPDPAKATGTDEEKMLVFRQVRDDIQEQVLGYLRLLSND